MPWFQIETLTQTLTLTLTSTSNHAITLTRSQTLTRPINETFLPFSRLLVTWPPKSSFSPISITPQGCIFTLRHAGCFGISVERYVGTFRRKSEVLKFKKSLARELVRAVMNWPVFYFEAKSLTQLCCFLKRYQTTKWKEQPNSFLSRAY